MANNRLYIRCKQCGDVVFIGKHFGRPLCLETSGEVFVEVLNQFYQKHYYCYEGEKEYKHAPIYA